MMNKPNFMRSKTNKKPLQDAAIRRILCATVALQHFIRVLMIVAVFLPLIG